MTATRLTDARFTLADPTPRLRCPVRDAVDLANANRFPIRHRLMGPHRETIGPWEVVGRSGAKRVQCNCLSDGVVMNKTPSPYQLTRMYALRAILPM